MHLRPRLCRVLMLLLVTLTVPASGLSGQVAVKPAEQPHPLVESVTFTGLTSLEAGDLLATLATQPTACRTFILKPLCLVTHSHLFETRHYLDRDELPRDELRIRVYYWVRGYRHAQTHAAVSPAGRGVAV